MRSLRKTDERGQVLVIVAGILVVIIALVGLVIDGGYAWGNQREVQNASDAIAEAGAVQLALNVAGVSPARTDADVLAAVQAAATANGVPTPTACYTSDSGHVINTSGTTAATSETTCGGAAMVGGGIIPPNASGVKAIGARTFDTFLIRVIGVSQMTTTARATALAGYLTGTCAAAADCSVLPITVPVNTVDCDGNNRPQLGSNAYSEGPLEIIPLCQNGPGNVGWIDWTPTAGGASELAAAITNPSNPAMRWPGWYYMTATGNVNSTAVQTALRAYDGQTVMFPQFDGTCDAQPTDSTLTGCPAGHEGGTGSNQWYHVAQMAGFTFCYSGNPDCVAAGALHGAYVAGSNSVPCNTGNGSTSCIAGHFATIQTSGEVTSAPPPNCDRTSPTYDPASCLAAIGVQLIH